MKKIISFLLIFVVLITNINCVVVNANVNGTGEWYGDLKFDKSIKTVTSYSYSPENPNVVIPSEIDGVAVEAIGVSVFGGNKAIKSVILPNGLKEIPQTAFNSCVNLEKIVIPDTVEEFGYGAFFYCKNLTEINMPINLKKIDNQAFEGCKNLKEVILPEGLLEIHSSAFRSCDSLEKILLPSSTTFINNGSLSIKDSPNVVVYGYAGSKAEAFANSAKIPFELIGGLVIEGENSVQKDKEIVLKANCYDDNGNIASEGGITWSCSDEGVAQITPWGNNVTVKGLKGGKATIIATHAESGMRATHEFEVVSYVMTLAGGYTVMLDEELEINYAVKQGEEYVHNDLDIKWEIESKDSSNAVKIISDKDNAYTRALTIKGINEGECELVAKVDGAELGRTKITVDAEIKVYVDGEEVKFDQPPVMKSDRVLVPIRKIAEKMGDTVKWNNELSSALIIHPDRMVVFQNNNNTVKITKNGDLNNWSSYTLDVPAQVINGRTLTPVRAIGECLGAEVKWVEDEYAVYIETDKNVKHTITEVDVTRLNAYYSTKLNKTNFSQYSPDINSFFDSRTNTWGDAFLMWWDDWWLGIKNIASGEDNDVYMMKLALAEVLAETPENEVVNAEIFNEIFEWATDITEHGSTITNETLDLSFTKKLSTKTRNAISSFGDLLDKSGIYLEIAGNGVDMLCELLSDYTVTVEYLNTIQESLKKAGISDSEINSAIYALKAEYENRVFDYCKEIAEGSVLTMIGTAAGYATGGVLTVAEFGKNVLNTLVGNDKEASAVKTFYALYCFNYAIDDAYNTICNDVFSNPKENLDEYINLFNFQKTFKTKIYQSMDQLRNKKDAYTKERIDTVLSELGKVDLITFQ